MRCLIRRVRYLIVCFVLGFESRVSRIVFACLKVLYESRRDQSFDRNQWDEDVIGITHSFKTLKLPIPFLGLYAIWHGAVGGFFQANDHIFRVFIQSVYQPDEVQDFFRGPELRRSHWTTERSPTGEMERTAGAEECRKC